MISLLGGMVAAYFFYIIVSLIFKHKVGFWFLITTGCLMIIFSLFLGSPGWDTGLYCICTAILTHFVKFFRVRNNSTTKKNTQISTSTDQTTEE